MPLTLITGPMKSGKSLELIARVAPHEYAQRRILFIRSTHNTREHDIRSRLGVNTQAVTVANLQEVGDDFDVIGIDEINMFDPSDVSYIASWLKADKHVFVSGLDLDYRGRMPEVVLRLLELQPETHIRKVAVCDVCHEYTAQFTQILDDAKPVLDGLPLITPEDNQHEYQARCRNCFIKSAAGV